MEKNTMDDNAKFLADLAAFTIQVSASARALDAYPVLGADEPIMFVDLCTGDFDRRKILKAIHVDVDPSQNCKFVGVEVGRLTVEITLERQWQFMAFVALVARSLRKPITVANPLIRGNWVSGWEDALEKIDHEVKA
jgi:hypothetical protein